MVTARQSRSQSQTQALSRLLSTRQIATTTTGHSTATHITLFTNDVFGGSGAGGLQEARLATVSRHTRRGPDGRRRENRRETEERTRESTRGGSKGEDRESASEYERER